MNVSIDLTKFVRHQIEFPIHTFISHNYFLFLQYGVTCKFTYSAEGGTKEVSLG